MRKNRSHIITALSFVATLGLAAACSPSDPPETPENTQTLGTRTYKLDPAGSGVEIEVYGVYMGTPDAAKLQFLMRTLKNAGEFSALTEAKPGYEGGLTMCGTFAATADTEVIYDLIRSIETDPKSTSLSAKSVSSCTK